mgnify:CR=1 FL=1
MSEITGNISFDDSAMTSVIADYLDDRLRDYAFREDIANTIAASDVLCSSIAEDLDYGPIIEGVTEDIRFNHMDEIVESMTGDLAAALIDDVSFCESFHEVIQGYVDDNVEIPDGDELNLKIANLEKMVARLTQDIIRIEKKPFWRFW